MKGLLGKLKGAGKAGPCPEMVHLDLKGLKCPLPALKAKKALAGLSPGARLMVVCTDPMTVIDIPHVAQETGDIYEGKCIDRGVLTFILRKAG